MSVVESSFPATLHLTVPEAYFDAGNLPTTPST